jgi:hypothetical protein
LDLPKGRELNEFLGCAPAVIHPNANMEPAQQDAAIKFIEEVVALETLEEEPVYDTVLVKAPPLFIIEITNQPGEYRFLADMKDGEQTCNIGANPTFFPKPENILCQMNMGGYSAERRLLQDLV